MIRIIPLAGLVLLLHTLASCSDGKPVAASAPPPPVTVARPLQKTITEWDEYTGRFVAVEHVEVRARVSGFIDTVNFAEVVAVPVAWPRDAKTLSQPDFVAVKSHCLDVFSREVARPAHPSP